MIAPSVATKMDQTLKPVAPVPPRILATKPPTEAPAIPKSVVMIKPSELDPGMIQLASNPTMSSIAIQEMSPTFLPPSLPAVSFSLPVWTSSTRVVFEVQKFPQKRRL